MPAAFEVRAVSKTFRHWWSRREVCALRNVSFAVQPGTIFGLLGPNGAGKTTLVKIALTIAYPDRYRVERTFNEKFHVQQVILADAGFTVAPDGKTRDMCRELVGTT